MIKRWFDSLKNSYKPDEWEVKKLLASMGIRIPEGLLCEPGEVKIPETFNFPVVVKVCDSAILHKTDAGGVVLNVKKSNYHESVVSMQRKFPGKRILVEKMNKFSGLEFIIGGLVDPTFGPAVMVGAGGILTELYKDVTFRLVPLNRAEALRMLRELTISDVLEGYRGSTMDIDQLSGIIVSVGELITGLGGNFNQLDINPLVYSDDGWTALDGMLVLNKNIKSDLNGRKS